MPAFEIVRLSAATSPGIMAVTAVTTAGFDSMSIVPVVNDQVDAVGVGELGERERAGAERERGERREQCDDSATPLPAAFDLVLDDQCDPFGQVPFVDGGTGGAEHPMTADDAGVWLRAEGLAVPERVTPFRRPSNVHSAVGRYRTTGPAPEVPSSRPVRCGCDRRAPVRGTRAAVPSAPDATGVRG